MAARSVADHEMTAAHPATDKALFTEYGERPLGRALRHAVLLGECLHRWDARGNLAGLDPAAQDRRKLQVQRFLCVMVDAHMITVGT
jgi:hypothetical protein